MCYWECKLWVLGKSLQMCVPNLQQLVVPPLNTTSASKQRFTQSMQHTTFVNNSKLIRQCIEVLSAGAAAKVSGTILLCSTRMLKKKVQVRLCPKLSTLFLMSHDHSASWKAHPIHKAQVRKKATGSSEVCYSGRLYSNLKCNFPLATFADPERPHKVPHTTGNWKALLFLIC